MLSQDDWCMKWIKNELRMNWNHMNYEVDIRWPVSLEIHWKLWEVVVSGCRTPWYFLMVISGPGTHQTESQIWIPNDSQNDSDSRNIHRDRRWAPCAPCALCAPRSYLGDLERRLLGCEVSFGITLSRFVKQLSKILNMFEHHLLGFSIVISAFLSYHWAFRSRLSLCHFVTLQLNLLNLQPFVILCHTLIYFVYLHLSRHLCVGCEAVRSIKNLEAFFQERLRVNWSCCAGTVRAKA